MSPAYLFVYGTLRRGSRNRFAGLLAEQARFAGDARMPGRLYDLGRHPGAVPSHITGDWVRGEIFLLKQPATTLTALDRYEGPKYERRIVPVQLASGNQIEAATYLLRQEPTTGRIRSGQWTR